jgi:NTE family protein
VNRMASLDPVSGSGATPARPSDRSGIALAMSGGGYRAMLFHTGAVIRLNELCLLRDMKRISSVSGGSITAALLGLKWQQLRFKEDGFAVGLNDEFVKPILEFSTHTIDKICAVIGFITQGFLVGKLLAWYYDQYLYRGATLADLPGRDAGPLFVICASNLSTGSLFRFSRPYIADWRLGRMPAGSVSLALAVAASSAFPPFLSPIRLNLKNYPVLEEDRPRPSREVDFHAVPGVLRHRAVLTDGGVYDNHGLEPIDDWETIFVSDGGMRTLSTRLECGHGSAKRRGSYR